MKMNKDEVVYMMGYLNHSQIVDAVIHERVRASSMIDICEYMNKHYWGGYEGCIRFCYYWEEDKELGRFFRDIYMNQGHLGDFDEKSTWFNGYKDVKDTEENFLVYYSLRKDIHPNKVKRESDSNVE